MMEVIGRAVMLISSLRLLAILIYLLNHHVTCSSVKPTGFENAPTENALTTEDPPLGTQQNNRENWTSCLETYICLCSLDFKIVNCSGHRIISFTPFSSQFDDNVEILDLSSNSITKMEGNAINGYRHLQILNLSFNNLSSITNIGSFASLRELNCANNQLRYFEVSAFEKLKTLEILNLSVNILSTLPPGLLANTTQLKWLDLSQNNMMNIHKETFSNLKHLEYLDLSQNKLLGIDKDLLSDMIRLKILNLSQNELTQLPAIIFHNNRKLEVLNLAENPFSTIQADAFKNLSNLRIFNVSFANLTAVPSTVLSPLTVLEILDLSNNWIATLHPDTLITLVELKRLESIRLFGNPVICDCSFVVLQKHLGDVVEAANSDYYHNACDYLVNPSNYTLINISALNITCDQSDFTISMPNATLDVETWLGKNRRRSNTLELIALKYNPRLGWYTAGVLFGMLMVFMAGLVVDKFKRMYHKYLRRKLRELERAEQQTASGSAATDPSLTADIRSRDYHQLDYRPHDDVFHANPRRKSTCSALLQDYSSSTRNRSDVRDDYGTGTSILLGQEELQEENSLATDDTSKRVELAKANALRNKTLSNLQADGEEVLEVIPGIQIVTVNPECPLHGLHHNDRG